MKDIETTLGGERWTIKFVRRKDMPKKTWGDCDWEAKIIRVRKDLSIVNVLDTLIHELRHGQHQIMFEAEEFIDSTSTELAKALYDAGIIKKWDN
tara:strand:- start:62 stop:346 length:285 start_codon:yes stop_codon:yes gene_type:complete